jgi:hypothetical protein
MIAETIVACPQGEERPERKERANGAQSLEAPVEAERAGEGSGSTLDEEQF